MQYRQMGISNKIANKIAKVPKNNYKITQKQLQMIMIKK